MREPSVVIAVTASVDDDGLVHVERDDVSLVRWNHRPAIAALSAEQTLPARLPVRVLRLGSIRWRKSGLNKRPNG